MGQDTPTDTRERILRVALEQFTVRGYHATSVREIAKGVGVTKTAVLYHFPGKEEILGALCAPMLDDGDVVLAAAEGAGPEEARWLVLEGMLEVWLTHRKLLRLSLYDLAVAAAAPVFARYREQALRANALVAGPSPDFQARVLAAQAMGMLGDPVVLFADAPTAALRTSVLSGLRRLFGGEPAPKAPAPVSKRTRRGRPSALSPEQIDRARRLYDGGATAEEIAAKLGVSRATVYRLVAK